VNRVSGHRASLPPRGMAGRPAKRTSLGPP
jgi:hypothetical protein